MSLSLFVAIALLIVLFSVLTTLGYALLFQIFWNKTTAMQKELLASIEEDDESFDLRYEQNRQIINPIDDDPFTK